MGAETQRLKADTMNREASEHISNMASSLHLDTEKQICSKLHGDAARAIIWCIRKIEELFCTGSAEKPCKVVKFWGIELPLERGLSFRDLVILIVMGYFIYVHVLSAGVPLPEVTP